MDKQDWTEEDLTINLNGVLGDLYKILIPVLCFQLLLRYNHDKSQSYRDLRHIETERQRQETETRHNGGGGGGGG